MAKVLPRRTGGGGRGVGLLPREQRPVRQEEGEYYRGIHGDYDWPKWRRMIGEQNHGDWKGMSNAS